MSFFEFQIEFFNNECFKNKTSAFWGMVSESKDKNNLLRLAGVIEPQIEASKNLPQETKF